MPHIVQKRERTDANNAIKLSSLKKYKKEFEKNSINTVIQNALCSSSVTKIAEVRSHLQSIDRYFSHTIDPKLVVSNQGLSGRCWLFALLNVMRHELIRKLQLPYDFELSGSYLAFYEKLEKCNNILSFFMDKTEIDHHDRRTANLLYGACEDGGDWTACANLIKKYGIVPKSCFEESIHSYETEELNKILEHKIKRCCLQIVNEKNMKNRFDMKEVMMKDIWEILAKMMGTPPSPTEKIVWSYILREDLSEKLEREVDRKQNDNVFTPLQIKNNVQITPKDFYKKEVIHDLNDYMKFCNDPRNPYYEYYESFNDSIVLGGEKNGYYNLPIEDIAILCVTSILNNTPVQCDIDVQKFLYSDANIFDSECFNYDQIFKMDFNKMTKEDQLNTLDSYANHAICIVGFDYNNEGKLNKFKIENSWGRNYVDCMLSESDDSGYYTMSYEWFKKYSYCFVIHQDYVNARLCQKYKEAKQNPKIYKENDILG